MLTILEKILSIRNQGFHKVICLFGIKLKFINKQKLLLQKQTEFSELKKELNNLKEKQKYLIEYVLNRDNKKTKSISSTLHDLASIETANYVIKNMSKIQSVDCSKDVLMKSIDYITNKDGLILEFGVFSGRTINQIAQKLPEFKIFGFDSFEGLPEDWRTGYNKGTFAVEELPKVESNVELIKGWFDDTLEIFLKQHEENCSFIHIDCDLYSSTKTIFKCLKDRIKTGTVIVFDEYFNYPGWKNGEYKAFQEFINETSLKYEYIIYNQNHEQCAVVIK